MSEKMSFNEFWESSLCKLRRFSKSDIFNEVSSEYGIDNPYQKIETDIFIKAQLSFLSAFETEQILG